MMLQNIKNRGLGGRFVRSNPRRRKRILSYKGSLTEGAKFEVNLSFGSGYTGALVAAELNDAQMSCREVRSDSRTTNQKLNQRGDVCVELCLPW